MPKFRVPSVVVTGSRNFHDGERIEADLRALLPLGLHRVAQGGNGIEWDLSPKDAPKLLELLELRRVASADTLAWMATQRHGLEAGTYHVDERLDGKWPVCGPRRNRRMLQTERPALVLAYPTRNSRGTWNCAVEAFRMRITTLVWVHWAIGADAELAVRAAMFGGVAPRHIASVSTSSHRVIVGDLTIRLAASLPLEIFQ